MKNRLQIKDGGNAFLTAYLVMFALQFIVTFAYMVIKNDSTYIWVVIVCNQIAFAGTSAVYCSRRNISLVNEFGLNKKLNLKKVALVLPISITSIITFMPLAMWFVSLFGYFNYKSSSTLPDYTSSWQAVLLGVVLICVLPAIGEEFLMRGMVAGSLKRKNYTTAILMSALIFSLMHGSPTQTVHQFGLGIVLGYVALVSGDIKYAMLLHFCNNLISVLGDLVLSALGIGDISFALWQIPIGLALVIIGSITLFTLLRLFTREQKKYYNKTAETTESVFSDYPTPLFDLSKKSIGTFIAESINILFSIFKKGGLKACFKELNTEMDILQPVERNNDAVFMGEFSNAPKISGSIYLSLIVVSLVWIMDVVAGLTGLLS